MEIAIERGDGLALKLSKAAVVVMARVNAEEESKLNS